MTTGPTSRTASADPPVPAEGRNAYVDWLRAFSLIVVLLWHWAFTIMIWRTDGPHATSPLAYTPGFWLATCLLQVMPLFFYIGGYVHLRSWERAEAQGERLLPFVRRRLRKLAVPASYLLGGWVLLGTVLESHFDLDWMARGVRLVVSPLWFIGVYLGLIALLPVSLWLHRRFGVLVLVWFAGLTVTVDVLRFRYHVEYVGWLNLLLVWGLAHQAGFSYRKLVNAPRRLGYALMWGGLFGLVGLVLSDLYPRSMVGVPGDRISNMAPPTIVLVALLMFQIGLAEVLRPTMERLLPRRGWRTVNETINRYALPLYLLHSTGMAISRSVGWRYFGATFDESPPDAQWWLSRPLAILGPLVCTIAVIALLGRQWATPKPTLAAAVRAEPVPVAQPD